MLEIILIHTWEILFILCAVSALLLFFSIIGRLEELRELVIGFRRMQATVFTLEETVNALQAEVRRALITHQAPGAAVETSLPDAAPVEEVSSDAVTALPATEEPTSYESGLARSRRGFFDRIKQLFGAGDLSVEGLDDLEGQLLAADLGPTVVARLRRAVEEELRSASTIDQRRLQSLFSKQIELILDSVPKRAELSQRSEAPLVILIVGVNGVGKTTTCAKLGKRFSDAGKKVLLVAADTFRAAAVDQLKVWGERLSLAVCAGAENAKPQTVVFDAAERAVRENFDVVIVDTAGRLHNKANLMQELGGIRNAIERHIPGAPHETVLVLDGTTGQNALSQGKEFNEVVPLTGFIVTKLDGTSKGGVVVALSEQLKLTPYYIGLGEKAADLVPFDARRYSLALLEE